jgi:PIN domain nuclease of toxin-antitoxin system
MAAAVLDSHALLAFFRGEEGAVLVKKLLHRAATILTSLPIEFHPATRRLADLAAGFKARFKLSLAAAFAAALAREKKADLVTSDPEFKPLEKEIKINWLK